jgi:hypothetical protein
MPVTLSYDLSNIPPGANDRTYIRSMLERFGWRRLGGSVFRYEGFRDADGVLQEDWLNHVAPALMFFRSYLLAKNITLTRFTLDTSSVVHIDQSDPTLPLGFPPQTAASLNLQAPTNPQSAEQALRNFITASTNAIP